jgi:hypothetical protein
MIMTGPRRCERWPQKFLRAETQSITSGISGRGLSHRVPLYPPGLVAAISLAGVAGIAKASGLAWQSAK